MDKIFPRKTFRFYRSFKRNIYAILAFVNNDTNDDIYTIE